MSHENQQPRPEIIPNFYSAVLPAIDSILLALVAKNSDGEVRVDNFVPHTSPGGIYIERRSADELILPVTTLARTINDQVNITRLTKIGSPFDGIQISRIQEEYRATQDKDRQIEWLCSYVTLLDYDGAATRAEIQFDANSGPALHITAHEDADHTKISTDIITALRAAQHVVTVELAPALTEEEISSLHDTIMPPLDPHARVIGATVLAMDHQVKHDKRTTR